MMRQISTEALAGLLVALCACAACEPDGHCLYVGETGAACGEAGICVDWRCIEVR
jgi:hypothetical protein